MNSRNDPLSPVSVGGSEWSGISKYNQEGNSYPSNRGQLASPPISTSSGSTMNGGYPTRGSSGENPGGAPSPPSSIARSSIGTGLYAQSDSGRGKKDEAFESVLSEHYVALKRYLAASLRDEKGNPRVNRARDKLLRLSPVQFQELSTDVFDELLRRQQTGRRTPNGASPDNAVPQFLLPKDTFHPKRNQARQKLSTLPPPRFRDLATDVFYELERRFPRFVGGDLNRVDSPASSRGPPSRNGNGNGTPVNGPPRLRRPSDASSVAGYSMRSESRNGPRPPMNNGLGIPPSPGMPPNDYGRPTPKTFQSNTIVPNKSTMVEDDETGGEDDDDETDTFALEGAARDRDSKKSSGGSETDKKLIDDYQSQVTELREKLDAIEDNLKLKDDQLNAALEGEKSRSTAKDQESNEWAELRMQLESKLADAQNLNDSLQSELQKLQSSRSNNEQDLQTQLEELREQLENAREELGASRRELDTVQAAPRGLSTSNNNSQLEEENEELRAEIREQQNVAEEVRREAQEFLKEMRILSERSDASYEKEDQLTSTIARLEEEVRDWRNRYARTKAQLRTLRASSIGLSIQQDAAQYMKNMEPKQADGVVKDVHVTKFQISIDEILRTARSNEPGRVIDFMKHVVVNVRNITQDIDDAPAFSEEIAQLQAKLKARVSATANNLITASKNFASANGLSPVSLLDAAASHLTAAVVELVRTVKIRPTPVGEVEDDDDGELSPIDPKGLFPIRVPSRQEDITPRDIIPIQGLHSERISDNPPISPYQPLQLQDEKFSNNSSIPPFQGLQMNRMSADSSMYSPINSPRQSEMQPSAGGFGKDGYTAKERALSDESLGGYEGMDGMNGNVNISPPSPMGVGFGIRTQDSDVEELRIYLEDQTALLVQNIQSLVSNIRSDSGITAILSEITAISNVVNTIISATETAMSSSGNGALRTQGDPIVRRLASIRQRLLAAGETGKVIAEEGGDDEGSEEEWRTWMAGLPPIAFQIAHETKDLVGRVDAIDNGEEEDEDFA